LTPLLNGNFALLYNDGLSNLEEQIFSSSGAPLSSPITVAPGFFAFADAATLANGNVVVVANGDSNNNVHAVILDPSGNVIKSDFAISASAGGYQGSEVSALSDGGFVVTWIDNSHALGDNSGTGIAAQIFDSTGTATSAPFLVNSATAGFQYNGGVGALANGGFVSTWFDSATHLVDAQMFDAAGGRVGGVISAGASSEFSMSPYVATLGDGDFVIAWNDGPRAHAQVFHPDGSPNGTETTTARYVSGVAPKGESDFVMSFGGINEIRTAKAQILSTTNDDAHSELVQNPSTGQLDFLDLTGAALTRSFLTSIGYWPVVAEGDFNGDGQSDLVTQLDGHVDFVYLQGQQVVGSYLESDVYWDVKGSGHFPQMVQNQGPPGPIIPNPSGFDPVLVTQSSSTGQIDLVALPSTPSNPYPQSSLLLNGNYEPVVGVGDFYGDGGTEIATQNSAGQIDLLSFSGANLVGSNLLLGNYWPVKGVADVNHDGLADLITQSPTTGQIDYLMLNGYGLIGSLLENTALPGLNVVNGTQTADQFWNL
jgi:hypothetical protein